VIERERIFFARLLQDAQALELRFEQCDFAVERFGARGLFVQIAFARGQGDGHFAEFAFHGERAAGGLFATR